MKSRTDDQDSAVAILDRPRVPKIGDTVQVYYQDDQGLTHTPTGPIKSQVVEVISVADSGDPDTAIDVRVTEDLIDEYPCAPIMRNLKSPNHWVLLSTDDRPIKFNLTFDPLPPVGSTSVAVMRYIGGRLTPIRARVVAHVIQSASRLRLATPKPNYIVKNVLSCLGTPARGRWGFEAIGAETPLESEPR